MFPERAEVVICGAGVAGLSTAWQLAVCHGVRDVLVVDELPPLSLTSDKSTECYRNWWPDASMVALINRSIDLLEQLAAASGNAFALNRNGYLYLTGDPQGATALATAAAAIARLGAGELRVHRGGAGGNPPYVAPTWDHWDPAAAAVDGADLFLDAGEIRRRFPGVSPDTRAALHARRCGWLSAQQLGMLWLEQAQAAGARLVRGRVVDVELAGGAVAAVNVATADGVSRVATATWVNAAGPYVGELAGWLGVELPVFHELHRKVFFDDHRGVVPRESPLLIWNDPVTVDWRDDEREALAGDPAAAALLAEIPAGVHLRPEGGAGSRSVILLWNYHCDPVPPLYPLPDDPLHVPVVVAGMARLLPAFAVYRDGGRRPYVDGGYYTKTRENRPLIGPLGPPGAYLIGALSGFGVMASPAAGELLAAHVTGQAIPDWGRAFLLSRYQDPAYLASIAGGDAGQL
jgi:glycine/D-amino acid oxidase-like deaminating enzyme